MKPSSLIWYLENVFLPISFGSIYDYIQQNIFDNKVKFQNEVINIGFWPGGDRDGNPYVLTPETTLKSCRTLLNRTVLKELLRETFEKT